MNRCLNIIIFLFVSFASAQTRTYAEFLSSGKEFDWNAVAAPPEFVEIVRARLEKSKEHYALDEGGDDHKADFARNLTVFRARSQLTKAAWLEDMGQVGGSLPEWYYDGYLDYAKKAFASLTDEEAAVTLSYSEWLNQLTNGFLWNPQSFVAEHFSETRKLPLKDEAELRLLSTALQKLPSITKKSSISGRDRPLFRSHGRELVTENSVWIARPFLSTTRAELAPTARYQYKHNVEFLLEIEPAAKSRGKDIQPFSTRPEEEEVLFIPQTAFYLVEPPSTKRVETVDNIEYKPTGEFINQTLYRLKECLKLDCSDIR